MKKTYDPIQIYVLWHRNCADGQAMGRSIFDWFQNVPGGVGIPAYYCCDPRPGQQAGIPSAALAAVAVAHLLVDGHTVNGLYKFGQPRVGDDAFAAEFNRRFKERHFRFVNNNDSVTRVPPRAFGYSHTGELRYIDTSGDIQEDMGMWSRFLDRVTGRIEDFLKPGTDGLKDHFMSNYLKHIENALTSQS